ncbi:MAG TPA: hypothetical protein DCM32_07775 [Xanthomonadaceae bacterium]|jgi:hypothetical protein|nr:hypothetical protein [Xanthomonadaceae bacterium]
MSTGAWIVDTFGQWGPLVVLGACIASLAAFWFLVRPRLVAWITSDAALQARRQTIVLVTAALCAILSFAISFSIR